MFVELLKKSDSLIKWWKLELGFMLISLSTLLLVFRITNSPKAPYSDLLNLEKLVANKAVFFTALVIIAVMDALVLLSLLKSFKLINLFNNVINKVWETKTKNTIIRSKIFLSIVMSLIVFPWTMFIPKLAIPFGLVIIICKFLFLKNNKEIYNLAKNEIDKELESSALRPNIEK